MAKQQLNNKQTPEKIYNPYCFAATSTDSVPYTSSTWVKQSWTSEDYDTKGVFDVGGNKFVAPFDSVWHFDANARPQNGNERCITGLYVNGTIVRASSSPDMNGDPGTGVLGAQLSVDVKLNSGDYVEIYIWTDDGVDGQTMAEYNYFNGHLITAL